MGFQPRTMARQEIEQGELTKVVTLIEKGTRVRAEKGTTWVIRITLKGVLSMPPAPWGRQVR